MEKFKSNRKSLNRQKNKYAEAHNDSWSTQGDGLRTKMTRAPCRKRTGEAVFRAENVRDLITTDHKVLSENCESRNNHRYAVVVQDLTTQWNQYYPCTTETSHETETSLLKFLDPSQAPKVVFSDNSMEFGKACEVLSWSHRTSTPHRSETNGMAARAVRRRKKVRQQYCYNQGLVKGGGQTL